MASKGTFLTTRYGGYHHREIPKEDEELTHVGPGTPCGEYLRRFWQPVVFLYELKDLPVRIRVMGEDLVAFRDRSDRVGVVELHCSHRGTSLEFGQISERGIRCCYHGWLYDVDGTILETPGEPADSTLRKRLYHGAYPTQVYKGLVFAYIGPPDKKPEFPVFDTYDMPGYRPWVGLRHMLPCNWLQVKENSMDPAHLSFLHTIEGGTFAKEYNLAAELDFMETPIGMLYISTRRLGENIWVRVSDFICPNIHQFGLSTEFSPGGGLSLQPPSMTQWSVPVDDTHTMNFRLRHVREDEQGEPKVMSFGQAEDRPYEERQRVPGDYDAQVSQRAVAIHDLEHLATTDRGIIMLRKLLREGIRAVQNGKTPKGILNQPRGSIPTYSHNTVLKVSPAGTSQADKRLLREKGRQAVQQYIEQKTAAS